MDLNYNLNSNFANSAGYNAIPQPQNNPGTNVWAGSYPSLQQMQHLPAQMANMNLTDTGTNYLDAYMALSHQNGLIPPLNTQNPDSFYVTSVQNTPSNIPMAASYGNINAKIATPPSTLIGNAPLSPTVTAQMAQIEKLTPDQQIALLTELRRKNIEAGLIPPSFPPPAYPNAQQQQQYVVTSTVSSEGPISPSSTGSGSAPQTPLSERHSANVSFKSSSPESHGTPQHQRSFTISETSSTTSSTSIPGSPTSGTPSFSDDVIDSPRFFRSPSSPESSGKSVHPPIRSKSLKYDVKFPQDKCHKCLKKVYRVEMVGPVKGVVYHNTCFTCKICKTKLTLKNYHLNQHNNYDVSVYCKSHQPTIADKGSHIDANSVLIKSAMSVPKLDRINEQIKMNKDSKYHLGADSVEILHARNVPATNLQTANKVKATTWRKKDRKMEGLPPPDVVRHCDEVPEYDEEQYNRVMVENQPDYLGGR